MIHYCKGIVASVETDRGQIVLEVGSVGFLFFCTRAVLQMAEEGEPLLLYVHLQSQEDTGFLLFGFADEKERALFSMLTSVRGVGNRMAMLIMASLDLGEILDSIVNSQAALFTSLPGIGKKISERLCFELSEKVHKAMGEGVFEDPRSFSEDSSSSKGASARHTVLEALLSLGFARREALAALKEVLASEEKASTDESALLHQALRRLQP